MPAASKIQIGPETAPMKWTLGFTRKGFLPHRHNGVANPNKLFTERSRHKDFPTVRYPYNKTAGAAVLRTNYSREALREALAMVPKHFRTSDVPRPPQMIRAHSEGIVGRWYTNYWTLHSMKFQCQLAGVPWNFGERLLPQSNFDEPLYYVDYEESRKVKEYRSRWINVNRSMVGMTRRIKEAEEEQRLAAHKTRVDRYWSSRKALIGRIKAMKAAGAIQSQEDLPIKTMNLEALTGDS
jgi:hypothetical protein